ncbi:MAG: hypothetical protein C0615_03420 [Desulfuromonas sp.]|nr:MAG: hypothetical protein C0615_03420 [Desulfuromonas sp.]
MSSILKALKKLESEKSQHDELSTAVASDILRSSHSSKKNTSTQVIIGSIVIVALVGFAGYQFARSTPPPIAEEKMPEHSAVTDTQSTVTEKPAVVQAQPESAVVARTRPAVETPVAQVQPKPEKTAALPQPDDLPQLSGILYQESASDRMAIINDFPVMEGTMVEAYLVKTIHPDRVVLERNGNDYELILPKQ